MTSYLWKLTYTTIHLYYNISMNYFNLTRKFSLAIYVLVLALKRVSQQLLLSSVSKLLLSKWKYANISNNISFDTMMQNLELICQCLIDSLLFGCRKSDSSIKLWVLFWNFRILIFLSFMALLRQKKLWSLCLSSQQKVL